MADFAVQKDWSSPVCGCIRRLKLLALIQIAGTLCTGTSLERLEPCERETFTHGSKGVWAG